MYAPLFTDKNCIIKIYFKYNFVGRILGPRGLTAKQLEQETGCKIMVRGKGSMRDKKKVFLCERAAIMRYQPPIRDKYIYFSVSKDKQGLVFKICYI
jgi:hypothetical protein